MDRRRRNTSFYTALFLALLLPLTAAAGQSYIGEKFCIVIGWLANDIVVGIAILGLIFLGIGALFGKISWGMAIMVAVGIIVLLGAPRILSDISPNWDTNKCFPDKIKKDTPITGKLMILVLSDSSMQDKRFAERVGKKLAEEGYQVRAVDADLANTSVGAVADEMDNLLRGHHIVVVALGGDDAKNKRDPEQIRQGLAGVIAQIQKKRAVPLLVGRTAPAGADPAYAEQYNQIYPELASQYQVYLYPDLMVGIAGQPGFTDASGTRLTEEGTDRAADNMLPYLRNLLDAILKR